MMLYDDCDHRTSGCFGTRHPRKHIGGVSDCDQSAGRFAEFDIRRTKDHQLIAFHNPDLNGTDIRQLTYDEICRITGTHGYRVPLLQEVLELCRGKSSWISS